MPPERLLPKRILTGKAGTRAKVSFPRQLSTWPALRRRTDNYNHARNCPASLGVRFGQGFQTVSTQSPNAMNADTAREQ